MSPQTAALSLATQPISLSADPVDDRAKLGEVAQQFEAIFLRQMLAAARKTDFGGDDLFSGEGEDTFREMQDAHFADVAAKSGMIGFASSIEAQLGAFTAGRNG